MIIEKLLDEKKLTDTEKQIARYLLDESNNIENMTSTELAKKAYASQSTVVRLYKKIGIPSYREFIMKLSMEKYEYYKTNDYFEINPLEKCTSYENTKQMVNKLYEKTISNTNMLLNRNTITRICNRILNAHTIDIYASGICEICGLQFKYILQSIGLNCTFQTNINDFYMKNIKDNKTHVAIFMNVTYENETIIHVAKKIKDNGFYSIGIINNNDDKLSNICQDVLVVDQTDSEYINALSSLSSNQYLITFLSSLIIAKKFNMMEQY